MIDFHKKTKELREKKKGAKQMSDPYNCDFNTPDQLEEFFTEDAKDQRLKVVKVEEHTNNPDKPCKKITFVCTAGKFAGRLATSYYYFHTAAKFKPRRLYVACGHFTTDEAGKKHVTEGIRPEDTVDCEVLADVYIRERKYTEVENERFLS